MQNGRVNAYYIRGDAGKEYRNSLFRTTGTPRGMPAPTTDCAQDTQISHFFTMSHGDVELRSCMNFPSILPRLVDLLDKVLCRGLY